MQPVHRWKSLLEWCGTAVILALLVLSLSGCTDGSDTPSPADDGAGGEADSSAEGSFDPDAAEEGDDGADESPTDTDTTEGDTSDTPEEDALDGDSEGETGATLTVHLHRPDSDYEGWSLLATGDVAEDGPTEAESTDAFGAVFRVPLAAGAQSIAYQFSGPSGAEPASPATLEWTAEVEGLWYFSTGSGPLQADPAPALTTAPPVLPGPDQMVVHYLRGDGAYDGWGLHLWEDVAQETQWQAAQGPETVDSRLGATFLVDLAPDAQQVGLIVHKGDEKDPGPDMFVDVPETGDMVFVLTGSDAIYTYPVLIPEFAIDGAAAHWLSSDSIAWNWQDDSATQFELRHDPSGAVTTVNGDVSGGTAIPLSVNPAGLSGELASLWPHLQSHNALTFPTEWTAEIPEILRGEIVLVARDDNGKAVEATRVQIPGIIDEIYSYDGPLGLSFEGGAPQFALWAPTATAVRLEVADEELSESQFLEMTQDASGVWTYDEASADNYGGYYRFEVTVYHPATGEVETLTATDPYSVGLSTNSQWSQIIDLADPDLAPPGWSTLEKPALDAPEDIVVYEGHVRDFSIGDSSVPAAARGKFSAFEYNGLGGKPQSAGMAHLDAMAAAGLTHLHLLPFFDIATVNEDVFSRVELDDGFDVLCAANASVPRDRCLQYEDALLREVLEGFDPATGDAQEVMGWLRALDGFNWGYDPLHYNVPEGSYASDPNGTSRIVELRRAVAALNQIGLRVVMDVVYNHTNSAGVSPQSVLDRIVPGYYHRLHPTTGLVETSTCCPNTATEHYMMERLMIDSVLLWAKHYKIDAFRFDLMGHHMKSNMVKLREALDALTPETDGVDGTAIYVYGEGWNFGEVQNNAQGVNATQENMAGTGIGTFNDRLRDAARGGGPFDSGASIRANQGFVNGQATDPNEAAPTVAAETPSALESMDRIRVGLAGGLKGFKLVDRTGKVSTGFFVPYNGSPTGYTDDPQEIVNYVSKHDNQTLFDNNAYKAPTGTPMADRVRMQNLAIDLTLYGQGIPFLHMGVDVLRSKSMQRDSFDSGDWFNRLDWTYQDANWNVGLPREDKDGPNWSTIGPLLADETLMPTTAHIEATKDHVLDALAVRRSSPLFRLQTGDAVKARVNFHNTGPDQIPGLLVMTISDADCAGADLDPNYEGVLVVYNATPESQTFSIGEDSAWQLHPELATGSDPLTATASFDAELGEVAVPGRTAAVFVVGEGGAGPGCNEL